MTPRETARALHRLRDLLLAAALRTWTRDGWSVRTHLVCRGAERHEGPCAKGPLAAIDDDAYAVDLYPHPAERDQPVEKTMLHEVVAHVLLNLEGGLRDERLANELEDLLWPLLTPAQRRQLGHLVGAP